MAAFADKKDALNTKNISNNVSTLDQLTAALAQARATAEAINYEEACPETMTTLQP